MKWCWINLPFETATHGASFRILLKKEGIEPKNAICTLKLARYFDKEGVIPKYGLQYLRYYLKLNVDATPHTALGDILVLEALFNRIYAKAVIEFGDDTVAKMIEVSKKPVLYRRMPFGKHKGLKMEEVPLDYLQWLSGTDLEEDLRYTIGRYLGSRGDNAKRGRQELGQIVCCDRWFQGALWCVANNDQNSSNNH